MNDDLRTTEPPRGREGEIPSVLGGLPAGV
jgi:hypothetical protein